jgi:hypothetical protein
MHNGTSYIDELRSMGVNTSCAVGSELYFEGLSGNDLFLVLEGRVGMYIDKPSGMLFIFIVEPGGLLGAESVIDGGPRTFTARAETDTHLLAVNRENALSLFERSTDFARLLLLSVTDAQRRIRHSYLNLPRPVSSPVPSLKTAPAPPPKPAPVSTPPPKPAPAVSAHVSAPAPAAPAPAPKPAEASASASAPVAVSVTEEITRSGSILPASHPRFDTLAPEADSGYVVKKATQCPCCKKNFDDLNILNYKLAVQSTEPDMRTIYKGFDILWYSTRVCPHCNAASLSSNFAKLSGREAKLMASSGYSEKIPPFCGWSERRTLNEVFESYYLALAFAENTSKDPATEAMLWRRLYWLYGDLELAELKAKALDMTLLKYEEVFQGRVMSASEDLQVNLTPGDPDRLKGANGKAVQRFFDAVHSPEKNSNILHARHAEHMIAKLRGKEPT